MEWDGIKRRKDDHGVNDHDTLIELVQILTNHVNNFNELSNVFKDHVKEDKENFKILNESRWKVLGAFALIQICILPIIMVFISKMFK